MQSVVCNDCCFYYFAVRRYAECRHAECHGALLIFKQGQAKSYWINCKLYCFQKLAKCTIFLIEEVTSNKSSLLPKNISQIAQTLQLFTKIIKTDIILKKG
jgi:hypothetical protein